LCQYEVGKVENFKNYFGNTKSKVP